MTIFRSFFGITSTQKCARAARALMRLLRALARAGRAHLCVYIEIRRKCFGPMDVCIGKKITHTICVRLEAGARGAPRSDVF